MRLKLSSKIIRFLIASGILTIVSIILGLVLPKFTTLDALMKIYGYYILGAILTIFFLKEFGVISKVINMIFKIILIYKIAGKPGRIFKKAKIALNNFFVISGILLIVTVSLGLLLPQFPFFDLLIKNYAFPLLFMCMTIVFGWHFNFKSLYQTMIILFVLSILLRIVFSDFQGEILGTIEYILLLVYLLKYKKFIHESK